MTLHHPELRARLDALLAEVTEYLVTDAERGKIRAAGARLDSGLTVALIGRVSSGKSTLLNALVGDRVALTDAGECTRIATLYRHGLRAHTEVVGLDGTRRTLPGVMLADYGRPADEIDFAIANHHSRVLANAYRVIDTPGISSGSEDPAAQRATERAIMGAGDELPKADVTLFMTPPTGPREDELEFLRAMGANRHNTVFLLHHADQVGSGAWGDEDPFEVAAGLAAKLALRHSAVTGSVLPIAALLAETATLGVTEAQARALAALADRDDFAMDVFTMDDLLQDGDGDPAVHASVTDLHRRLSDYGLRHGRVVAADGAAALNDWLLRRSGLPDVRAAIGSRFLRYSSAMKAIAVLDDVRRLASGSRHRRDILDVLDDAEQSDELHLLRTFDALDTISTWRPEHPLVAELDRACTASTVPVLLGLPDGTPSDELERAALDRQRDCQRRKATALAAPELLGLRVLERGYQLTVKSIRAARTTPKDGP